MSNADAPRVSDKDGICPTCDRIVVSASHVCTPAPAAQEAGGIPHVCGSRGFSPMHGDECLACNREFDKARAKKLASTPSVGTARAEEPVWAEQECSSCGQKRVSHLACWDSFHAQKEPSPVAGGAVSEQRVEQLATLAENDSAGIIKYGIHGGSSPNWKEWADIGSALRELQRLRSAVAMTESAPTCVECGALRMEKP